MRVLITAGGTVEQIDDVRGITNFSTGRLGSVIASQFSEELTSDVTYICGKNAIKPGQRDNLEIIEIGSTDDLLKTLSVCLTQQHYDVIVHSMAVSDYYLAGTASEQVLLDQLQATFEKNAREALQTSVSEAFLPQAAGSKKISSNIDTLYLQLKQTPKVISVIKELQPTACLVGFKLLVGVPLAELLTVGQALLVKNKCDFVLANDKMEIDGDQHTGHLLDSNGHYTTYTTKQAIAQGIVEHTMRGRS